MASIPNHDWLKAQNSRLGWRWRVTFCEALFTIARWPVFRIIAKLNFYFWTAFLFLRYFLYVLPCRLVVGTGPQCLRMMALRSIFWRLRLELEFAYWMVGRAAPIAGKPSPYFHRPRLGWFFGLRRRMDDL